MVSTGGLPGLETNSGHQQQQNSNQTMQGQPQQVVSSAPTLQNSLFGLNQQQAQIAQASGVTSQQQPGPQQPTPDLQQQNVQNNVSSFNYSLLRGFSLFLLCNSSEYIFIFFIKIIMINLISKKIVI